MADNKLVIQLTAITEIADANNLVVGVGNNARRITWAAFKTLLSALYQPLAAGLTSLAALGTAAGKIAYTTAENVWAEADVTAFGRSLLAAADDAAAQALLDVPATSVTDGLTTDVAANTAALAGLGALADLDTVGATEIDDNSVTLAELEHGTQGDILYYGASGAPARLGTGTIGQVLQAGGAGGNPSWTDAASGAGAIAQVVGAQSGAVVTGSTITPYDDSIPLVSEGTGFLSQAITPTDAGSTLRVDVVFNHSINTAARVTGHVHRDGASSSLAATSFWHVQSGNIHQLVLSFSVAAGSTSATTFQFRAGGSVTSTVTMNGEASVRVLGGVYMSAIYVTEILP